MKFTFVIALVPYLDVKAFGFKNVLSKTRNDLTKLETVINVTTNAGHELKLMGKNMNFVADNLAYHAVFGFVERLFWVCVAKSVLRRSLIFFSVFEENVAKLRTPESCRNDVAVKGLGVKNLLSLETNIFDPYKNFTADLHHDIFQGGLLHTVKIVLHNLIFVSGVFTLEELNER